MTEHRLTFQGGWRTIIGFAVAFAVVTAIWVPLTTAVADLSAWLQLATEIGKFAVIFVAVWALLRIDEVRFAELGLSRWHLRTALVAFAGLWVGLNALGFGIAVVTGHDWAMRLIWQFPEATPEVQQYAPLPATGFVLILLNLLVIGPVEEIAFRGYFQSKLIALVGDDTRLHIALGIGVASLVFGALHTPAAIVAGNSLGGVVGAALAPTLTAILFGIVYELTHNVYFVALLHGFGNTWPLVVEWATWSGTAFTVFWIGTACIYLSATFAYRYWTHSSQLSDMRRTDSTSIRLT